MLKIILLFITAYLLGSLNIAIIVSKIFKLADPRQGGSKNPGATNVNRLSGKKWAAVVLFGDALKGVVAVLLAKYFAVEPKYLFWIGLTCVLGHMYPIFFGFKGGKGVATSVGVLAALSLPLAGLSLLTWGLILLIFNISGLAALVASILTPIFGIFLLNFWDMLPVSIIVILIIWRHRNNIKSLLKDN